MKGSREVECVQSAGQRKVGTPSVFRAESAKTKCVFHACHLRKLKRPIHMWIVTVCTRLITFLVFLCEEPGQNHKITPLLFNAFPYEFCSIIEWCGAGSCRAFTGSALSRLRPTTAISTCMFCAVRTHLSHPTKNLC